MKNFSFISIFLQYHSLPDSYELAKFLVDEYTTSNLETKALSESNKNAFQFGLDMLIRLKKYEDVFMALINNKMLTEALLFMKRYKVNIEFFSSDTSNNLKSLILENKRLTIDYLNS
jgi:hypothetical protein